MASNKENIILKISGAALKDAKDHSILDVKKLTDLSKQIKQLKKQYNVIIIVGGGNIWRGVNSTDTFYDRTNADHMGMLATIINGVALKQALENENLLVSLYSLLECPKVSTNYQHDAIIQSLKAGSVVILSGGTGRPYFSTDTAAAVAASELSAKYILMAKDGVDGVYSADPKKDKTAKLFKSLTYQEVISKNLKVMDITAITICAENNVKILVFNIERKNAINEAILKRIPVTLIA